MNVIFLGSSAVMPPDGSTQAYSEEQFVGLLASDPAAIGVFMCRDSHEGFVFVRGIRSAGHYNPLYCLMYGTAADHSFIAKILNAGADQVEKFPVDRVLFRAQLQAIVRRGNGNPDPVIRMKNLHFDRNTRRLTAGDEVIHLTELEANVLFAIISGDGDIVTKQQIIEVIYGYDNDDTPDIKIVDIVVCRLRRKMSGLSGGLDFIQTVWGRGFAFVTEGFAPHVRNTPFGPQRYVTERAQQIRRGRPPMERAR